MPHSTTPNTATCNVVIRGQLSPTWVDYFGELTYATNPNDNTGQFTYLTGQLADISAYAGLINQLLSLGVTVQETTFKLSADDYDSNAC